jgi:colanic acid biosynthesis glycosyl transferase WcaI
MRLALLTQWYDPEPGSAAVPGVLARELLARGHQVSVVTGFPNFPTGNLYPGYRIHRRLDEDMDGVAVRRVALYPNHSDSGFGRFANFASFALSGSMSGLGVLRAADAVWVYNSPATVALPSGLASARGGPPHLMHVMDLWPDAIGQSGLAAGAVYRAMVPPLQAWCRLSYRRAAAIACISASAIDELVNRGVPAAKLHHIPIWTDETQYYPRAPDPQLASELGVAGADLVLLYAGNLGDPQGLHVLLDACARLADLPGFRCLIAGSGTAEGRLRRRANELRLSNVSFIGRWRADDMGRLMSVADVHLVSLSAHHPSTAFSMPSKLPAILASGGPVLAAATGETARIVERSGAGWVVDPGNPLGLEVAVREAHARGEMGRAILGSAGNRFYESNFSLEHGVDAVEGLLEELARDRQRRSHGYFRGFRGSQNAFDEAAFFP